MDKHFSSVQTREQQGQLKPDDESTLIFQIFIIYDILSYLVTENSEPKVDNIFYISSILILSIITIILNSIFLKIFKSVDLKNKIFEDNIQIISYLYLFFPLGLFIFPIVSSIFNIKL